MIGSRLARKRLRALHGQKPEHKSGDRRPAPVVWPLAAGRATQAEDAASTARTASPSAIVRACRSLVTVEQSGRMSRHDNQLGRHGEGQTTKEGWRSARSRFGRSTTIRQRRKLRSGCRAGLWPRTPAGSVDGTATVTWRRGSGRCRVGSAQPRRAVPHVARSERHQRWSTCRGAGARYLLRAVSTAEGRDEHCDRVVSRCRLPHRGPRDCTRQGVRRGFRGVGRIRHAIVTTAGTSTSSPFTLQVMNTA